MRQHEAFGGVRGQIAEGELAEHAVGQGLAEGFGEGDVGGEEYDVGDVGGGQVGSPLGELVIDDVAFVGFVQEVVDHDDGALFWVRLEPVVVGEVGVLFLFLVAVVEGELAQGSGCGCEDFGELAVEGFGEAGLDLSSR